MWLGPTGTRNPIRLENTNQLVRDASRNVDGLKTGFTNEAGYLLVATEERDGMRLISVVMRADTSEIRYAETRRLLNFGFTHEYVQVGEAGKTFPVEIARPSVRLKCIWPSRLSCSHRAARWSTFKLRYC